MTLIVYKDGVLAADCGATRDGSREASRKLRTVETKNYVYHFGYAGEIPSIEQHFKKVKDLIARGANPVVDLELNCSGLMVEHDLRRGTHDVYSFNNFKDNPAKGVLVPERSTFVAEGWGAAVTSALAIESVTFFDAPLIIYATSEINSGCDTKYGVDTITVPTGKARHYRADELAAILEKHYE
jgi:hypothetical protein